MAKSSAIKKAQQAVEAETSSAPASRPISGRSRASKIISSINELGAVVSTTYDDYIHTLTPRLKLIDIFLAFLVALGILQFLYVLAVGNFPFNAFLGGFISCVGQFVLIVSLRLQIKSSSVVKGKKAKSDDDVEEEAEDDDDDDEGKAVLFDQVSPERAFGDFVFASLILHFIVYHFIN